MRREASSGLWKLRAFQLDVARHFEPVDVVLDTIEAAARDGFNTVVLYLEGRIRTRTFPYRPAGESYSPDDIQRVVRHAGRKGIDLIPVIPTLGHAEQFLTCEELTALSEEREGQGRFGPGKPSVFCISKPETYDFLETYCAEIAALFPSRHFHAGLDEAWDFGFCPLCRKRWRREGLGRLFIGHVLRMESLLRRLGKRMWMWDDMFELFPEELERVPKSVVLCHWNYDAGVEPEGSQAHFVNRTRRDWLGAYARLGLDAVFCPWNRYADNIESLTRHAAGKSVMGGLLTQWEGSPRFFPDQAVMARFTGRLWNGAPPDQAWTSAIGELCGPANAILRNGLKTIVALPRQALPAQARAYLGGPLHREEQLERDLLRTAIAGVTTFRARAPARSRRKIDHLLWSARMDDVFWRLRELVPAIYDPRRDATQTANLTRQLGALAATYRTLLRELSASSRQWRLNLHSDDRMFMKRWTDVSALLGELRKRLERRLCGADWLAVARLHLQDFYGAPRLKLSVVDPLGTRVVAEGCFKPDAIYRGRTGGHYDYYFPFACPTIPQQVIVEGGGYGGQGIAFVALKNRSLTLIPDAVLSTRGPVTSADALLRDDSSVTRLGDADIARQMLNPTRAERRGVVLCRLKVAND